MERTRIDWVAEQSKLLRGIAEEFARTQPFKGLTIGTGIHLEAKTVALLLTLQAGGAKLVSTGNLNTTQVDAVERLRAHGVTVIGEATKDAAVHATYLQQVVAAKPDLILDNGGDLFMHYQVTPARVGTNEMRVHLYRGDGSDAGVFERVRFTIAAMATAATATITPSTHAPNRVVSSRSPTRTAAPS